MCNLHVNVHKAIMQNAAALTARCRAYQIFFWHISYIWLQLNYFHKTSPSPCDATKAAPLTDKAYTVFLTVDHYTDTRVLEGNVRASTKSYIISTRVPSTGLAYAGYLQEA